MIAFENIRDVHLEISSLCNAACPWCPRTFWGYTFNGGYPELYLSLNDAKKIFYSEFLAQLLSIRVNGNFGDIVMNPDGADIVEYFVSSNSKLKISVSTNGGARDKNFWQRLAKTGSRVTFALDGLADTHHLYRQNTVWSTVINNAKHFIAHGGIAEWQMIRFKHNAHQIDQCRQMSKDLGFKTFQVRSDGRDTAPVFDKHGNLTHILGDYSGTTEFEILFERKKNDEVLLEDIVRDRTPKQKVNCETQILGSIYIAANGDVSPCCWTGFYPRTYGKGQYHQAANAQLIPLIEKNNALLFPLQECIEWFRDIEFAWTYQKYEQGRLLICDDNCGSSR
jgi:MoaA/NifB/PqqE/SkfB family radical SAM enzyme